MSVNERFFDDSAFLAAGEEMPEPHSTAVLLARLKLNKATSTEQFAGVKSWLATHVPSKALARSLKFNGYGALLLAAAS